MGLRVTDDDVRRLGGTVGPSTAEGLAKLLADPVATHPGHASPVSYSDQRQRIKRPNGGGISEAAFTTQVVQVGGPVRLSGRTLPPRDGAERGVGHGGPRG